MKQIVTYLTLASMLFGVENTIVDRVEFEQNITPDTLHAYITIKTANQKDQNSITKDLNTLQDRMKENQQICSGGTVSIFPQYSYTNSNRDFLGYTGESRYMCEFKKVEEFQVAYSIIYTFLEHDRDYQIVQSPISWVVDEEKEDAIIAEQKDRAILYGYQRAKVLTKLTDESCYVTKTDFITTGNYVMTRGVNSDKTVENSITPNMPIKKDKKIKLNVTYEFTCR